MLKKQTIILLILFLFNFTVFSQGSDKYLLFEHAGYDFPYQLAEPDKSWELPKKLVEISGLSYIDKYRLACIQDEKGNIYIFNLKAGEVEQKVDFGGDGDYEGIEIIENDAWILKSNGTLFKVKDYLKDKEPHINKYPTALTGKNDAEGLAYDPVNNNLLIACKGHPFLDYKEGKEFKAIYSFDLKTKRIDTKPFLLIEMDTIKYYKNYNTMTRLGVELLAYFDSSKGDVSFQPSGIAIHPISGNIFILASVGNLLIVFSREGGMLAMIELKSTHHPKPEGICFSPNGTLYISNEGDGEEGTILKFELKKY
ncbi:MAG: SdiA-regulated domain-containing protein [Bacteroidales bacterium]|nr:SdiA-regulated domain-containing protein [Bacteroidales bacterium]